MLDYGIKDTDVDYWTVRRKKGDNDEDHWSLWDLAGKNDRAHAEAVLTRNRVEYPEWDFELESAPSKECWWNHQHC